MNIHPQETPFLGEGPQPLLRAIPPGAPYPVAALGPLAEAVLAVQGATLAPVAIPAQSALAVASLAVQGFADAETLGGTAPPSLYALTIAQSGERKSTCDTLLMAALRAFERERAAEQREAMTAWRNAQALWKGEREKILAEAKGAKGRDKKTAAQADLAKLGAEPTAPPSPDRTVTEPTFEGLTRLYAEGMPSLGIFADEGGQFIGGHGMNSDNRLKTLAALNDIWQGNPIRRTRAGDGAFTLYGRRLAIHLMCQPEAAQGLLGDRTAIGTGFLPRFLICAPPSAIGTRLSDRTRHDAAALRRFADRLRAILDRPLPMFPESRELVPRALPLAPDARAALVLFADETEREQAPGGPLSHVTGFASKAAEQAARIAAVLTLWRDLDAPAVALEAIHNGITLARFYLAEALRQSDGATVSTDTARAEALRLWLLDIWPEQARRIDRDPVFVTPKDIVQYGPNALRETALVRKLMAALADAGWLVLLPEGEAVDGIARKLAYRIVRG